MKFLVIYDWENGHTERYPLNHITYEIIENKLHVSHYDTLHVFPLNRYDYSVEESQRRSAR